ncbi:MAG: hypothetical protein GY821_13485 [Gammaproteobacteria bacterium]|nr:hypothetical protein [Gammaproteobacteria bacterium]
MTLKNRYFNILAYLLTLIGYMTLTISLPLIPTIAQSLKISGSAAHSGIGTVFLLFSMSNDNYNSLRATRSIDSF